MAVTATLHQRRLRLNLDGGFDGEKQKIKTLNYSRVSNEATDEGLHKAAIALASLGTVNLLGVLKIEDSFLESDV